MADVEMEYADVMDQADVVYVMDLGDEYEFPYVDRMTIQDLCSTFAAQTGTSITRLCSEGYTCKSEDLVTPGQRLDGRIEVTIVDESCNLDIKCVVRSFFFFFFFFFFFKLILNF